MTTRQIEQYGRILRRFVEVYCTSHHGVASGDLCPRCADLLEYALGRLARCPMDPKPRCKDCTVHCYQPEYREQMRQVMRFSGMYFVKRGRVDWLLRYYLAARPGRRRIRNTTNPHLKERDR